MLKRDELKELRDTLFAMRSLNMDFGVSEESILDEISHWEKTGRINPTDADSFFEFFNNN